MACSRWCGARGPSCVMIRDVAVGGPGSQHAERAQGGHSARQSSGGAAAPGLKNTGWI